MFVVVFAMTAAGLGEELEVNVSWGKPHHSIGDTVVIAFSCRIADNYHLYGNPLGPGIGKPLKLTVEGAEGVAWIEARKSAARRFQPDVGAWVWAYEKEAVFFIIGILKSTGEKSQTAGAVTIDALMCHTACVPIVKKIPFAIPLGTSRTAYPFANDIEMRSLYAAATPMEFSTTAAVIHGGGGAALFPGIDVTALQTKQKQQWDYEPVEEKAPAPDASKSEQGAMSLLTAIILAFIAGIILNAMPCVLPVLGIKILTFSQAASAGRREAILRSMVFGAGMLFVFIILATLAAFAGYSWGQQFQNPAILAGIIAFIVAFSLGMFDAYTINVPSSIATMERTAASRGLIGEFGRGVFATILATPCSGPFLGATLAWTLTQPTHVIYAVFIALGAGMAFPYILLSSSSRMMRLVPKPGRWMDDFKHVMGFLLLGFGIYLMKGLSKEMVLGTIGLCVSIAFGIGLYSRFAPFGARFVHRISVGAAALLCIAAGGYVSFRQLAVSQSPGHWEAFSPQRLQDAHMTGRHAIANFTASWCMNCQYNKLRVLNSKEIRRLIEQKDIFLLEVDLTGSNPDGESLMQFLGSRSVPFLAVFPGDDPYHPIIMRDILNKRRLAEVLKGLADKED